jgi:carbon-monoxide dehydrogenase medium subunit
VTVEEASRLLSELDNAKLMAGGTDLIPKMKQRIIEPDNIISLKKIQELTGIKKDKDTIFIGAATTLREIEQSKLIQENLPLLYECIKSIGSIQIRNMGTLGGNVCNASPAADGALGLITMDATIIISSLQGKREIKVPEFFKAPGLTLLKKHEIVEGFKIKIPSKNIGYCFISIGRTSLDISTISIGVALKTKNIEVLKVNIALGSVAPTPLRLYEVEEWLKGKTLTPELIKEASRRVSNSIKPITDIRGTAEYRYAATEGLAREAITKAWKGKETLE